MYPLLNINDATSVVKEWLEKGATRRYNEYHCHGYCPAFNESSVLYEHINTLVRIRDLKQKQSLGWAEKLSPAWCILKPSATV